MSMELLPCPFCGGQASMGYCSESYKSFAVICDKCGSEGPDVPIDTVKERESGRHKAADLWNIRTTNKLTG